MSDYQPINPETELREDAGPNTTPPDDPAERARARVAERGAVTGVELARGLGHQPAKGFWAETWSSTIKRPLAVAGLSWVAFVAVVALVAPVIASGHPLIMIEPARLADLAYPGSIAAAITAALTSPPAVASAWLLGGIVLGIAWAVGLGRAIFGIPLLSAVAGGLLIVLLGLFAYAITCIGRAEGISSPMWNTLSGLDVVFFLAATCALVVFAVPGPASRPSRAWPVILATVQAVLIVAAATGIAAWLGRRDVEPWVRELDNAESTRVVASVVLGALSLFLFSWILPIRRLTPRLAVVLIAAAIGSGVAIDRWNEPLVSYNYVQLQAADRIEAAYTLVPFSPDQRSPSLDDLPPMSTLGEGLGQPEGGSRVPPELADTPFVAGTDSFGQDVLTQLIHACRLAVSIGLVSTGIAVTIGVTMGALMGYFGGWVDILLYRVVEIFMSTPRLLLLIVAAAVLPRNTYVMMIVIGAVTWTGAARFTRAEFMKLRDQDFVQAARAAGLPLPSILFKHMLPNGVTPVLVDASFQVAAAILIEAILSFLGLGPADQASWGRLLQDANSETGLFSWWLAIFPGGAIFLTVLSYNLIGEALRDAIDPKLKKARV